MAVWQYPEHLALFRPDNQAFRDQIICHRVAFDSLLPAIKHKQTLDFSTWEKPSPFIYRKQNCNFVYIRVLTKSCLAYINEVKPDDLNIIRVCMAIHNQYHDKNNLNYFAKIDMNINWVVLNLFSCVYFRNTSIIFPIYYYFSIHETNTRIQINKHTK